MHIIVGLGNPGDKYAHTHHNVGFDVLDLLAEKLGVHLTQTRCKAKIAEVMLDGQKIILAEPQTFMNLSGESVAELVNWYKVKPADLLVVYDDIDLPPGHMRFRAKGSAGTHNGMRSIISLLGRDDFPRLRIGVGSAPAGWDLVDWVLAGYQTAEAKQTAQQSFRDACDVIHTFISSGAEAANRYCGELQRKFDPPKPQRVNAPKVDFAPVAQAIQSRIDSKFISGAVCAVTIDGKMAYQCVDGLADVSTGRKMTRDTAFRLASMTKPLTAAAVMILWDRRLIGQDDQVSDYLPEFAHMTCVDGSAAAPITIRHLLTHSSGVGQDVGDMWDRRIAAIPHDDYTLENIVKETASVPLGFQPGTRTGYSAIAGMNLLARVVEVVSGAAFDAFLEKEIFHPLGMGDTGYYPTERQLNRLACVYEPASLQEMPIGPVGFDGMTRIYPCGSAGLIGTMPDYLRFAQMLCDGGNAKGGRVLSEEAVRMMTTPQLPPDLPGSDSSQLWGLGMRVITAQTPDQPLPVGAFGWSGAYGTHFWIDPAHRLTCVLMAAGNVGGASSPLSREVEAAVTSCINATR